MVIRLAVAALIATGGLSACGSDTNGSPAGTPPPSVPVTTPSSTTPRPTPSTTAAPSTPSSSSTSARPTTHPVPASPLHEKTVTATDGSVYAISVWAEASSSNCAAHAYGKVASYLAAHRCLGVQQVLATTSIDGRAVGFEQNSVAFQGSGTSSYTAAGRFLQLVTKNGTGNLNDLLREGYRLPAGPTQVPSPDAFKALGQDNGVVVTDAWYLTGATPENDPALVKMAEDLFLQF